MMTNTELLAIAKKQLGNGGSKYRKYVGASGNYCNMFVYWLFNANGCASLFPLPATKYYRTYCPDSIKWCRKNLAEIPPYIAMVCDIIYMDWEPNGVPNHIGIVDHKVSTTAIATIEGNTSGGIVAAKTRNTKYTNIFRPHFKGTYKKVPLVVDGDMGYQTIGGMQAMVGAPVDTILGIGTVKKTQAYCGAKEDGAWGADTSKKLQSKMAKEGYYTGKIDSAFGKQSVIGLQKMINAKLFTVKPAKPTAPKPTTPTVSEPKAYTGAFPDLVTHSGQKIAYTARDLAYAKGTSKSKYKWDPDPKKSGKAKAAFTTAINKVYPKRSSWSKQCQAGASCDVGAGTIIRYSGVDSKVPRGLQEQLDHFKKSSLWKKTGLKRCSLAGDVAMHPSPSAHIWIGLGDGNLAEANHSWRYFEHITKDKRTINSKAKSGVYRCTKASPIQKGDRGTEVKKLQAFLNWAGYNCGTADGVAGDKTDSAIKAFQKDNGLTVDGQFGSGSLAKAKTIKR